MTAHLNDEQFTAAALGDVPAATQSHLHACFCCRSELARLRAAVASLGEGVRAGAARPEGFWLRQRAEIAARIASRDFGARAAKPWAGRLAWSGALAAVILAALLSLRPGVERPAPVSTASADADEELLLGVEQSLRRPLPQALSPGVILVNERNRAARLQQAPAQR